MRRGRKLAGRMWAVPAPVPVSKGSVHMKVLWTLIGIVVTVIGIVFFVQGIGILAGSFMTGQIPWAVFGAILILVGIGLILYINTRAEVG